MLFIVSRDYVKMFLSVQLTGFLMLFGATAIFKPDSILKY